MRLAVVLLCGLSGCSLDLARLRGAADASLDVPGLDAPARDAPPDDATDAPPGDAADTGSEESGPRILDVESVGGPGTWVAVAPHPSGARVVVIVPSLGSLHTFVAAGEGCGLVLTDHFSVDESWVGAPALARLTDDDYPDIVAQSASGELTALLQTPDLGITLGVTLPLPDIATFAALAVGDLTEDGRDDLFAVQSGPRLVRIESTGGGALEELGTLMDPTVTYADAAVADLNDDDLEDLATLAVSAGGVLFEARMSSGTGMYPARRSSVLGSGIVEGIAIGALAARRRPLYALVEDELWVGQVNATDVARDGPFVIGTDLEDLVVADVDGDGIAEVVVSSSSGGLLEVVRLAADGATPLLTIPLPSTGMPTELAALDVDGDRRDELFVLAGNELVLVSASCLGAP